MCFVVLSVKQGRITKYKRYTSPTGEWAEHGVHNEQGSGLQLGWREWGRSGELYGSSKEEMLPPQN